MTMEERVQATLGQWAMQTLALQQQVEVLTAQNVALAEQVDALTAQVQERDATIAMRDGEVTRLKEEVGYWKGDSNDHFKRTD